MLQLDQVNKLESRSGPSLVTGAMYFVTGMLDLHSWHSFPLGFKESQSSPLRIKEHVAQKCLPHQLRTGGRRGITASSPAVRVTSITPRAWSGPCRGLQLTQRFGARHRLGLRNTESHDCLFPQKSNTANFSTVVGAFPMCHYAQK